MRVYAAGVGADVVDEVWATALCVAFLRGPLAALADDWRLLERKAVKWLARNIKDRVAGAPSLEDLVAAAAAALVAATA